MLRMSRLTDYGIVLLTHLAGEPGAVHNARELAVRAGLPLPVVSKILKALTREGFLLSQRGAKGGYTLARPPEQITVVSVIDALEGPIALTECGVHPGACERETRCAVRAPWQQINHAVRRTLEGVRLSELLPRPTLPVVESPVEAAGARAGALPAD
jgi:FeS assembly SUF system regulator